MNKLQSQYSQFGVCVTTIQAVKYHLKRRSDSRLKEDYMYMYEDAPTCTQAGKQLAA